jgi:hypothetical protein
MPVSNFAALEELQANFSKKDMIDILEFTLPRISQKGVDLQRLLADKAWDTAAVTAHQMLSSSNNYGSESFNNMLRQIAQQNFSIISNALFQQELQEELADIKLNIIDWLVKNK